MLRTYYHPDHLGSSSWITDGSGNAIQHLHYLPFGEDWVDQRNSTWNAPYTFSGKEKDVETSYGYFGARYYDSGLSIWLSVDPMSDKYPSMSPYNYCANNPVILLDPDGREIWIVLENIKLRYENGSLYNQDGSSYEGEVSGFLGKAVTSLNEIRSSEAGNLVTELEKQDGFSVEIRSNLVSNCGENSTEVSGSGQKNYIGAYIGLSESGNAVPISDFSPYMGGESMTADLGHELSHAMDMKNNDYNTTKVDGVKITDYKAVYNENLIRKNLNIPLRTHYSRCRYENSDQIFGCGPSMLRNGQPYLRSF